MVHFPRATDAVVAFERHPGLVLGLFVISVVDDMDTAVVRYIDCVQRNKFLWHLQ